MRNFENLTVFLDGVGLIGTCTEAELPAITQLTEEHFAGGMSGKVDVRMASFEAMKGSLTFNGMPALIFDHMGLTGSNTVSLQVRGPIVEEGQPVKAFEAFMRVGINLDARMVKPGAINTMKVPFSCYFYRELIEDVEHWKLEPEKFIASFKGRDILAAHRRAMGI